MQFELIDQLMSLRDDRLILRRIDAPEAAREHVFGGLAEQRGLVVFVAAAARERAVDHRVARVAILHEEDDVRHRVEHGFEQHEMREHVAQGRCSRRGQRASHALSGRSAVVIDRYSIIETQHHPARAKGKCRREDGISFRRSRHQAAISV